MYTPVEVINLGLGKIASSQIERIDPPRTSLERFIATGYPVWKRTELAKRRWVFATQYGVQLSLTETLTDSERPYKFVIPPDCVRVVRGKYAEWKQGGRFVFSAQSELKVDYIKNVPEAEFDALFVEVLACRIAYECVELVTQSNTKKSDVMALYNSAVTDAGRTNAYTIGAEDNTSDDGVYSFLTARY
jgi:hypothetical protein